MTKLLILDLSGNPIADRTNYRIYVIYKLHNLKVLDGTSIEILEVNQAKEYYNGRLSIDFLEENLGIKKFESKHITLYFY
jgi:hypothetical protein